MKLNKAIELAKACGLNTYRQAYFNIRYHAMNIFVYDKINDELNELVEDLEPYRDRLDDKFQ